jgi:ferredoxin
MHGPSLFEAFLSQHDSKDWERALERVAPAIHDVDRDAARVWFAFFPLALARAFDRADDVGALARRLLIQGNARLATQVDSSHRFLYGHRFWPVVKRAIRARAQSDAAPGSLDLAELMLVIGTEAAAEARVDRALVLGIAAVGLMTLQQVGLAAFGPDAAPALPGGKLSRLTPAELVRARARDDSQGVLGFLRGIRTEYSVTFDETRDEASFTLINGQHLTTAAANDARDYSRDPRCFAGGPIPVECRTAACGTCWVGVLGGRGKLSDVDELESRRIKEFGYIDTAESKPHIRLACMAQASGNVTIVIPPWNGIFGKFLRNEGARCDVRTTT